MMISAIHRGKKPSWGPDLLQTAIFKDWNAMRRPKTKKQKLLIKSPLSNTALTNTDIALAIAFFL